VIVKTEFLFGGIFTKRNIDTCLFSFHKVNGSNWSRRI